MSPKTDKLSETEHAKKITEGENYNVTDLKKIKNKKKHYQEELIYPEIRQLFSTVLGWLIKTINLQ